MYVIFYAKFKANLTVWRRDYLFSASPILGKEGFRLFIRIFIYTAVKYEATVVKP